MGSRLTAGPAEPTPGKGSEHRYTGLSHDGQRSPGSVQQRSREDRKDRSARGPIGKLRAYLPKGNTLDDKTFGERHLLLCWLLGLHIPGLVAFGLWQGYEPVHAVSEVVVPIACLVVVRAIRPGRLAAFFVTAGLVYCSAALVHISGGMIEAHFHFFILIGFIALYQDWVPFLWNVTFVVVSHGVGTAIDVDSMYNHPAAQSKPWLWASLHGTAVLCACTGVVIFWRHTELVQQRNMALRSQLAEAELAAAQTETTRRRSVAALLVHLARRNQPLLDRQLGLIADLEQRERQPDTLAELFKLDHMATRMRRNAESLLVLSGDDPPRRWGRPVPLAEVVRAAAAEVEAYDRVEIAMNESLAVEGRIVADLAHLLAELIENATTFSPPTSDVRVSGFLSPEEGAAGSFLVSIEDTGIGMPEEDLRRANHVLADTPDIDANWRTLGLQVVSRLARRHGLRVRLAGTPGGGLTAIVTLPAELLREQRTAGPPGGRPAVNGHATTPVATDETGSEPPGWTLADPDAAARMVLPGVGAEAAQTVEGGGGADRARLWPSTLVPSAPEPEAQPEEGTESQAAAPPVEVVEPELTPEGLVRRMPGQRLAPPLRDPVPRSDGPPSSRPHDRELARSMLSRFQASQRAGRAVAAGRTEQIDEQDRGGGEEDHE